MCSLSMINDKLGNSRAVESERMFRISDLWKYHLFQYVLCARRLNINCCEAKLKGENVLCRSLNWWVDYLLSKNWMWMYEKRKEGQLWELVKSEQHSMCLRKNAFIKTCSLFLWLFWNKIFMLTVCPSLCKHFEWVRVIRFSKCGPIFKSDQALVTYSRNVF